MSPRTVFTPYARLFAAVRGSRAFVLAGWLGRLPASTLGLGTVLLVAGETGSYGLAGAVSGTLAASYAVASTLWARQVDRRGQGVVLRMSMVALAVVGLAFLTVVVAGAPRWTWFVLAALTGATSPNIGSLVRARWAHALPDAQQRQTAFAFESVVDEFVFVVGPPLITLLASLVAGPAGFLAGLIAGVAGGWLLGAQTDSQPPPHPRPAGARRTRSAALVPVVVVVTVSSLGVGMTFGSIDVVVVAFAQAEGSPTTAGIALATFAGGSLVAGLLYGVLRLPGSLTGRFAVCSLLFGATLQLLLFVDSLVVLLPMAFLAGSFIAPTLVSGVSLVESRVPRGSLTEALTLTTAGLIAGVTVGAAGAGAAVDTWGAEAAFAVPAMAAALGGLLALAGVLLLPRGSSGETVPAEAARVECQPAG